MKSQGFLDVSSPVVPGKSRPCQQSSRNRYIVTLDMKGCICHFKNGRYTLSNPRGRFVDEFAFIFNPATGLLLNRSAKLFGQVVTCENNVKCSP